MSFRLSKLIQGFAVALLIGMTAPAFAGHDLRHDAQELERRTCALSAAIQHGYRGAPNYSCLLMESARLEALTQQIGCFVIHPHNLHKLEHLLRHAENQAERVCDLLNDVDDHCSVPKVIRKRTNRLIECVEDDIDDLADAVADCNDHHPHPRYRPVFGSFPRQGGWGLALQR